MKPRPSWAIRLGSIGATVFMIGVLAACGGPASEDDSNPLSQDPNPGIQTLSDDDRKRLVDRAQADPSDPDKEKAEKAQSDFNRLLLAALTGAEYQGAGYDKFPRMKVEDIRGPLRFTRCVQPAAPTDCMGQPTPDRPEILVAMTGPPVSDGLGRRFNLETESIVVNGGYRTQRHPEHGPGNQEQRPGFYRCTAPQANLTAQALAGLPEAVAEKVKAGGKRQPRSAGPSASATANVLKPGEVRVAGTMTIFTCNISGLTSRT